MIVIHGENIIQSRQKLIKVIEEAKTRNILVERHEADKLNLPTLESKLQKTDLFGHSRLLVIEGLHSLHRSKQKKQLIELVSQASMEICLWEKRLLTKTMLKKLGEHQENQVYEFKLTNTLFAWLDTLSPQPKTKKSQLIAFKLALRDNDVYMCLVMFVRQVRLLIQAKVGAEIKGPFFMINKIKKQANYFKLAQLLKLHAKLYNLDAAMKTSQNILELKTNIEQLIINL